MLHVGNLAHIPIVQGLIEKSTTTEHVTHIGYLVNIPTVQRVIEQSTTTEHVTHIDYLAQIGSVYPWGELHVSTTGKGTTHCLPLYSTELLNAQKRSSTLNKHTRKRCNTLRTCFYDKFAVLGGSIFIKAIIRYSKRCLSFQNCTICFFYHQLVVFTFNRDV